MRSIPNGPLNRGKTTLYMRLVQTLAEYRVIENLGGVDDQAGQAKANADLTIRGGI